MSSSKSRPSKRPSARRPSVPPANNAEGESGQLPKVLAPAATARKPKKRVSARRGAIAKASSSRSAQGSATSAPAEPLAQPASKPAGRKAKPSARAKSVPAVAAESVVPGLPNPAESSVADQPMPPLATELSASEPVSTESPANATPYAPPGVQLGDDDWETFAESAPVVQLPSAPSAAGNGVDGVDGVDGSYAGSSVERPAHAVSHLTGHTRVAGPSYDEDLLGTARAVLGTDYYYGQWGRQGLRKQSTDVDDFGLDPRFEERVRPWLEGLCSKYFRVEIEGIENLPDDGRALLVANRSGALPWDGLMLKTALRMAAPAAPPLRWLAEDSIFFYPFLGVFMNRVGAVRACTENAERLLRQSSLVAVFPEGARGAGKLFRDRYRLQRFGRGGYVRLALRSQAPVVPVAIVGGEEANPLLGRSKMLGRMLGSSYLPVTPTFPWLGPVGLTPAPVKWRIVLGEPLDLTSYGPDAADDSLIVHRLNEQIRGSLQELLAGARKSRGSVVFG